MSTQERLNAMQLAINRVTGTVESNCERIDSLVSSFEVDRARNNVLFQRTNAALVDIAQRMDENFDMLNDAISETKESEIEWNETRFDQPDNEQEVLIMQETDNGILVTTGTYCGGNLFEVYDEDFGVKLVDCEHWLPHEADDE